MRAFEIGIVCLILFSLTAAFLSRRFAEAGQEKLSRWSRFVFLGLLFTATAFHLAIEGAHWQMAPAYIAAILVGSILLWPPRRRLRTIVQTIAVLLLTGLTCGLSWALPVFSFPAPTGSFAIGTRTLSMLDTSRIETSDPGRHANREVVVQLWYPALPSHNPLAPYRRCRETSLLSSYQCVLWTHSRTEAPPAKFAERFPILLYSPGWGGRRTQDTMLTEEFASHGYLVAAIDHPYNAGRVALADGSVVRASAPPSTLGEQSSEADIYAFINQELARETDDTLFVLNRLERMNDDPTSEFYHRLDLSRIGAFGFSLGGMVAAESAWRNKSIRAVVDLDTVLYGESGKSGLQQPLMLLSEAIRSATPEQIARLSPGERRDLKMDEQDYARELPLFQKPGNYEIELNGALHNGFQDQIFVSPLQSVTVAGTIPPQRMSLILRQYILAFFDQNLRGVSSPLLAAKPSPFPEATVLYASPVQHGSRQ